MHLYFHLYQISYFLIFYIDNIRFNLKWAVLSQIILNEIFIH